MSTRKNNLSIGEITRAFSPEVGSQVGPILSPTQLAAVLQLSVSTIYEWIAKGRLDGTFRKRGKHLRFWRDRAIEKIFNDKDWC